MPMFCGSQHNTLARPAPFGLLSSVENLNNLQMAMSCCIFERLGNDAFASVRQQPFYDMGMTRGGRHVQRFMCASFRAMVMKKLHNFQMSFFRRISHGIFGASFCPIEV
ncbi:unnamed protein product [Aphanomyces euteiches]